MGRVTPPRRARRLDFTSDSTSRETHYLFRFPAKFHPPVVRRLIQDYTESGGWVLDPFCGSGTLLVEAALLGRNAIGCDVDPLAVFVTRVKIRPISGDRLQRIFRDLLLPKIVEIERGGSSYEALKFKDLSDEQYRVESKGLAIPAIPNLLHWFRRYVVIDLARLQHAIVSLDVTPAERRFFELCFASAIRPASNADPVPVSGLEVTAHMKRLEKKGRLVNPFSLFRRIAERSMTDMTSYDSNARDRVSFHVRRADATRLPTFKEKISAVITSPPYHGAVDYYRRHQLEMFWLGFTSSQEERLALLQDYVGRPRLSSNHPFVSRHALEGDARRLEAHIRTRDATRADAFKHYSVAMTKVFARLARVLDVGRPAILVVGHSSWDGDRLNTSRLFGELAKPHFELIDHLWYPVRNRYMSYARHNNANIDREFVLVLERTDGP